MFLYSESQGNYGYIQGLLKIFKIVIAIAINLYLNNNYVMWSITSGSTFLQI